MGSLSRAWTEVQASGEVSTAALAGRLDWNAELVGGDVGQAVRRLRQELGNGLSVGAVTLPLALADLGLIEV